MNIKPFFSMKPLKTRDRMAFTEFTKNNHLKNNKIMKMKDSFKKRGESKTLKGHFKPLHKSQCVQTGVEE